jgi:hypothetical protein
MSQVTVGGPYRDLSTRSLLAILHCALGRVEPGFRTHARFRSAGTIGEDSQGRDRKVCSANIVAERDGCEKVKNFNSSGTIRRSDLLAMCKRVSRGVCFSR